MEDGHFVAGGTVAFVDWCCIWWCGGGLDAICGEGEIDNVFCRTAMAGSVVGTAGWR